MSYNYNNFDFSGGNNCRIEHTKSLYNTTPGGRFRNKPYKTIVETVTPEFYINFVRSVSFFNNWGGGTCRAYWNYTVAGYIPNKIVTVSPDRSVKHVDTFTFIYE